MKHRIILVLLSQLFPVAALADCGYIPSPPAMLQEVQLNATQFSAIEPQMEHHFAGIESYKACIEDKIAGLVPPNSTEEYFSSSVYQTAFQALMSDFDLAEQRMMESTNRYNYLVQIGEIQ